jgi:probable rRNA maturation factor
LIELHLNRLEEWDDLSELGPKLRAAVLAVLETTAHPSDGELSITFVTDDEIRDLNRRYLGRDESTDVIAFELGESGRLMGDCYVSPAAAKRAALDEGIHIESELIRLAIHATLHAVGHDHPAGEERWASPMFELQERLVRRFSEPRARGDDRSRPDGDSDD